MSRGLSHIINLISERYYLAPTIFKPILKRMDGFDYHSLNSGNDTDVSAKVRAIQAVVNHNNNYNNYNYDYVYNAKITELLPFILHCILHVYYSWDNLIFIGFYAAAGCNNSKSCFWNLQCC